MKKRKKIMRGLVSLSIAALLAPPLNQVAPTFIADAADGVCINEICAKNSTFAAPDSNFYDWIELYNPTDSALDLSGYGLSDKDTKPYKFTFPEGTSIGAGQYIIVFCDSVTPQINDAFTAGFGLSTSGETVLLTAPDGTTADSVTFGAIASDVSYGRFPDGSDEFATLKMSPDSPNNENGIIKVDVEEPVLSHQGGFYDSGFNLDITIPEGTKVYYTLDGSVPTEQSTPFSSPINVTDISSQPNKLSARTDIRAGDVMAPASPVDKAMIVNAVAVDSDGNVSDTVSAAYFIGYQYRASYYQNVRVISLTTNEENLFDYDKGIYVLGAEYDRWRNSYEYDPSAQDWEIPGNYSLKGREWERPATIQIYEDGQLAHSQNVGIRIHGGASRTANQKSFNIYARSDYGASKFDFDIFGGNLKSEYTGKKIKEFDSFMLRNAGNDCQYTRFRDKLNQSLVADRDILTQGMDPCVVFINGEYWGHYEITEKLSDDYIEAHYGVNKNDVCIIKNSGLEEGEDSGYFEWQNLYNWVSVTDFSKPENYEQLCEKIDMQSFADYLSTEFYIGNMDFAAHNTAMWKATAVDDSNEWADGRWRFILFDTEFSADLYGTKGPAGNYDTFRALMNNNCFLSALFNSALRNADFKQMFSTTFADMANENFRTADVLNEIDRLSDEYREMAIGVYNRFEPAWLGGENAEPSYNYEVSILSEFYKNRFRNAMNHLKSNCGLKGNQVQVTLNNNTSEGTVTMNTITPAFTGNKWEGTYYTDYPVTVNAKPTAGYKFSHWETSDGRSYYTPTAEISLSSSVTITAVYDEAGDIMGDVNLDGDVNTADLVMLSKWLLGSGELTDWTKADTYSDGIIDVYDLVGLRKIVIG